MLKFGKDNMKADQSMQALVGLIHENINNPINDNINQKIKNIQDNIQKIHEEIEESLKSQCNKVDKKLKEIQYLIEDKYEENQNKLEMLEIFISDLEKNSFDKINASFDALSLDISTNKDTLLQASNILEQQLISGFSVQKTTFLGHVDVQILKVLDELESQCKYQTDQWSALSEALANFSNEHRNKLEVQAESISTLLISFDEKMSSKQNHVIEQITRQIKSSSELSLSKQQAHVNQLQDTQKLHLDQQTLDLKALELQVNIKLENHKKTQIIILSISIINLLLIAIVIYCVIFK